MILIEFLSLISVTKTSDLGEKRVDLRMIEMISDITNLPYEKSKRLNELEHQAYEKLCDH